MARDNIASDVALKGVERRVSKEAWRLNVKCMVRRVKREARSASLAKWRNVASGTW
jgi:hypothetical protein